VPINKKYPLDMLLAACKRYISRLGEKRVLTVEYTLLKDVNDKLEHAEQMVALLADVPCKINLIPFNPFPDSGLKCSPRAVVLRFGQILNEGGVVTTVRKTRGADIDAACGQLAGDVLDRTDAARRLAQRRTTEQPIHFAGLPRNSAKENRS